MTVYPVFWNARLYHRLGIYYYENGDYKEVDNLYTSKMNGDVQVEIDGQWMDATGNVTTTLNRKTATKVRSKGIEVTLPAGTVYGFFIEVFNSATGVANNNPIGRYYTRVEFHNNTPLGDPGNPHAASFDVTDGENVRYFLGFEDRHYEESDPGYNADKDFNDLIIILDHEPRTIVEEPKEWVIAAEDLGSTDDYDFNDVVFSVTHVNGQGTATVKPMAAGGIIPAYICYNGEALGEIHALLGGNSNQMINTHSEGPAGEELTITVPADFSMSYISETQNMGGFSIRVEGRSTEITAPGKGTAPQMFCVPAGWQWPTERTSIEVAYTHFGEWGSNQFSDWYIAPVAGKVLGNSK